MSVEEENKARQRRVLEEMLNNDNRAIRIELFHENFVEHRPEGDIKGLEAGERGNAMFRAAFPDFHATVDDMIAEGDKVVTRITMSGTLKGEFRGNAPTGRKYKGTGILITQWLDGKEIEAWMVFDQLDFYRQLGIPIPE